MTGSGIEGSGQSQDWLVEDQTCSIAFRAVALSMRGLVLTICAIILVGGALLTAVLIALDTSTGAPVARGQIIVLGGLLGIALTAALFGFYRWAARDYGFRFSPTDILITGSGASIAVPLSEIREIFLRCDSDYARVEITRLNARPLTYFAGLCPQPNPPRSPPRRDIIACPSPAVLDHFRSSGFAIRAGTNAREGVSFRMTRRQA